MPIVHPSKDELLKLPDADKITRFNTMVEATFSHVDGRDLLAELHPRAQIDIHRRKDAVVTVFEGDWLTNLMDARRGVKRHE